MSLLIAVALAEDGSISPFAGRALHWQVYVADKASNDYDKAWTIELTDTGCLHHWHVRDEGNRHPLHHVDIALAASAGEGVTRHLAERQTRLVTTAESDPDQAVERFLADLLGDGVPEEEQECLNPEQRSLKSSKK